MICRTRHLVTAYAWLYSHYVFTLVFLGEMEPTSSIAKPTCMTDNIKNSHQKRQTTEKRKSKITYDIVREHGGGGRFLCFLIPSTLFALFLSPSPSLDVTRTQGHSAGPSPPSPLPYATWFLQREDFTTFFLYCNGNHLTSSRTPHTFRGKATWN